MTLPRYVLPQFVLVMAALSVASPIRIAGTVYDRTDKPLSGVVVSLTKNGFSDTSKSSGAWSLMGDGVGVRSRSATFPQAFWNGKAIYLDLPAESDVSIDAYDLRGSRLVKWASQRLGAGSHELPMNLASRSGRLVCLRLTVNGLTQTVLMNSSLASVLSASASNLVASRSATESSPERIRVTWKGRGVTEIPAPVSDTTGFVVKFDTSTVIPWNENVPYGNIYDARDGQVYRSVKIGRFEWMAENLNYKTDSSDVYPVEGNLKGEKWGRLYKWPEVLVAKDTCDGLMPWDGPACPIHRMPHRGVCPAGWHIPRDGETRSLGAYPNAAIASQTGWTTYGVVSGNGTDILGWRALPGGYKNTDGSFAGLDGGGWFQVDWISGGGYGFARFYSSGYNLYYGYSSQSDYMSLRCVRDTVQVDGPDITPIPDKLITANDTVNFVAEITSTNKIVKVIWSFGDGETDTLSGGNGYNIQHIFPGSDKILAGQNQIYTLTVTAVDDQGDAGAKTAKYTVINDVPVVAVRDGVGFIGSKMVLHAKATDQGKITRVEWSDDGIRFVPGGIDTTIQLPNMKNQNYPYYVRVGDEDGNQSKVDTIRIFIGDELIDSRDGQHYSQVLIGNQVWMGRDLAFDTTGAVSGTYADGTPYRKYTWATAMKLPTTCDSELCASQVLVKHQGLCPSGWHVPNEDEWSVLEDELGGGWMVPSSGWVASKKMKATNGWNGTNGTDDVGFGALPNNSDRTEGYWWTATEVDATNSHNRILYGKASGVGGGGSYKTMEQGLRCLLN